MTTAENIQATESSRDLRTMVLISYGLYLAAFFNGFTAVIGLVVAYVKRADARGTVYESHFNNLITVFWVSLIACVVLTTALLMGLFGVLLTAQSNVPEVPLVLLPVAGFGGVVLLVWYYYRTIAGFVRALDGRSFK